MTTNNPLPKKYQLAFIVPSTGKWHIYHDLDFRDLVRMGKHMEDLGREYYVRDTETDKVYKRGDGLPDLARVEL